MNLRTTIPALVCSLAALCSPLPGSDSAKERPPKRFVDAGACPFECCTYRRWVVADSLRLFDRPQGRRLVAVLHKGESVDGLTGEVISAPVAVKSDRDIPATPIRAGEIFYVLHYEGEGDWKVWFDGATLSVNESVVRIPRPKAEWWVKVKTERGEIGWTPSGRHFLHQDACE